MKARTYVRLYTCFEGIKIFFLLLGFFFLFQIWLSFRVGSIHLMDLVFALMAIVFIAPSILAVKNSKKYCDALEERGLMEDAASQLREQRGDWTEGYILTNDYFFNRGAGEVICLKDLVRIELIRKKEYDDEWGSCERLTLHLTTRQGDTLRPSHLYRQRIPKEEWALLQQFEILRGCFPEIAVETVSTR